MMRIRNYFAFIIIVIGTISADNNIINKDKKKFADDILYTHNCYRRIHGVPELSLCPRLSKIANKYIKKWIGDPDTMKISTKYGSNTYAIYDNDNIALCPYLIFDNWYHYKTLYDYSREPSTPKPINPFTQTVWKSTTQIGVAVSKKDGLLKVLVLYFPAGNQEGKYRDNVVNFQYVSSESVELTDEEKKGFFDDILNAHNYYRRLHDSPDLVLDEKMCVIADMHLVEWKTNQTLTIPKIYGVNISQTPYKGKSDLSPNLIVLSWYKNQIHYNYEEGPQSTDTNPFTQVIWRTTIKIGVAIIIIDGMVYVLVIYHPKGNQDKIFFSNVNGPPKIDPEDQLSFHGRMIS